MAATTISGTTIASPRPGTAPLSIHITGVPGAGDDSWIRDALLLESLDSNPATCSGGGFEYADDDHVDFPAASPSGWSSGSVTPKKLVLRASSVCPKAPRKRRAAAAMNRSQRETFNSAELEEFLLDQELRFKSDRQAD